MKHGQKISFEYEGNNFTGNYYNYPSSHLNYVTFEGFPYFTMRCCYVKNIKPLEGFYPQSGKLVINNFKKIYQVVGVCNEMVFMYKKDDGESFTYNTRENLEKLGYKVLEETPTKELTKQEIADKFGIDVKELRIKE